MTPAPKDHWESVYQTKAIDELSWFRSHLETSLGFVKQAGLGPRAAVIDIGGGASTFVDDTLELDLSVTVLDLSASALAAARARLGQRARAVTWSCADVLAADLPEASYDLWHDRAVFHFLIEPVDRASYLATLRRSLKPGGVVVLATFGPNGPDKCSGLRVARYTPEDLHRELGAPFELLGAATEIHRTPWGSEQEFSYCFCRLPAAARS
ncbi:MAG: class I SAM-dependent methyltransferase [Polyangiaceae bacterium]|nr:class I SAM-dependent methyltransferase [Polyangiaceae bacterium]